MFSSLIFAQPTFGCPRTPADGCELQRVMSRSKREEAKYRKDEDPFGGSTGQAKEGAHWTWEGVTIRGGAFELQPAHGLRNCAKPCAGVGPAFACASDKRACWQIGIAPTWPLDGLTTSAKLATHAVRQSYFYRAAVRKA
eukprot:2341000-Pleurochrysis_carterae.AAC.1